MKPAYEQSTLGVVVIHLPGQPWPGLPAVVGLLGQVDELLLVLNGDHGGKADPESNGSERCVRSLRFPANRGTAAAWNAALTAASDGGFAYLYILDQDSVPLPGAVAAAHESMALHHLAAVVQPAQEDRLRLDPFPWNTVASGSLLDVEAVLAIGGFDERLFVDEVDHELFARLVGAGHGVASLPEWSIEHQTGSPRDVTLLGAKAVVSGHGVGRRRLQGFSAGVLVRRYLRRSPATASRLVLRQALTASKDLATGEPASANALARGLASGLATGDPPTKAAERACPYCAGPLVGRFAGVTDWIFATSPSADVYRCMECGALAAGYTPGVEEVASWYSAYFTHAVEPERTRVWSRLWPTPKRRREISDQHRYYAPAGATGRFLEVGAGAGQRLVEFADAGWDVVGQDLDPAAGHLARASGIPVHGCEIAELVGSEEPFDLIGLTHVLEHAVDPAALLRACADLLAPGGRICVICPNAQSLGRLLFGRWWFGLDQPRHLGIPTLTSLDKLRLQLGLETVHAGTAATNAAVVLGGSLERIVDAHLPPGRARHAVAFSVHLLGQALGRAAVMVNPRLGEEVVWVGRRAGE